MCRLQTWRRAGNTRQGIARRRLIDAHRCTLTGSVERTQQLLDWHPDEIRITHVLGAVTVRAPQRLDNQVLFSRAVEHFQVETREDVECIDQSRTTGRRWRCRHDARPAVLAVDRPALLDLV